MSRASRCLQGLIHSAVAFWGRGRVCGSERKVRDLGPGCLWRLPWCPQQALPETYPGQGDLRQEVRGKQRCGEQLVLPGGL